MKEDYVLIEDLDVDEEIIDFIKGNVDDRIVRVESIGDLGRDYREGGGRVDICDDLDRIYKKLCEEDSGMKSIRLMVGKWR